MKWRGNLGVAAAVAAALAGCDPRGKSGSSEAESAAGERRSREHETCSSSADCAGDLRCFDGVCRRTQLSVVGDLYAAVGDRAVSAGQAGPASEAYAAALSRYDQEKIDPPAQLLCAHGGALIGEPGANAQKLERAARLLHRCLAGAPAGSFLRQRALGELAALVERGLNPDLLGRSEPTDHYLTRATAAAAAPAAPSADSLVVQVKLESRSRSGSFRKFAEFLQKGADLRSALAPCWKAHFEKTRNEKLSVTVPFQYGSTWDEDEIDLSSWIKIIDAKAPADPPAAEATACARKELGRLVEAEGKKLREEARWRALGTFAVGPGKL